MSVGKLQILAPLNFFNLQYLAHAADCRMRSDAFAYMEDYALRSR